MRDIDVRKALREQTLSQFYNDPHSLVVEEMGVCQGSSRVDVAVVNGCLHGYEIKSESDTLERLEQQAEAYSLVFDRVTLVLSEKHAKSAKKMTPRWWGIAIAKESKDGLKIIPHREGKPNKKPSAYHIAQLLWKEEALDILKELGADRGLRSRPRTQIWEALSKVLPIAQLQARVRDTLRSRESWRVDPQPQ